MNGATFFRLVDEYRTQLKLHDVKIRFVMEIVVNGRLLRWPGEDGPGWNESNSVTTLYSNHLKLKWEGRKLGDFYWYGEIDDYKQTINRLLLDNLATKIQLMIHSKDSLDIGIGVLNSAIKAIEAKDHYTRGHSDRVAALALKMADFLDAGYSGDDVETASKLHDIGKIGVSEIILCKPGVLTGDEIKQVRRHPDIGANILKPLPIFAHLVPAIRHHHERYDGTGYPQGLAGNDIPLLSRIIAVADTFDALTSNRPYRKAMGIEKALEIIAGVKGSQLDPLITGIFLAFPENMLSGILAG